MSFQSITKLMISGNTFTWKSGKGDDTGVIAQEIEALGLLACD